MSDIPPILAAALSPIAPKGSTVHAIAAEYHASQEAQKLRPYLVLIGTKQTVRLRLPVMARSSSEAQEQHECLALEGERVEVLPHAKRSLIRAELSAIDRNLADSFAGSEPFVPEVGK